MGVLACSGSMVLLHAARLCQVNSPWFKLYLYSLCESGPPSLLLTRGTRLCRLPRIFDGTRHHHAAFRRIMHVGRVFAPPLREPSLVMAREMVSHADCSYPTWTPAYSAVLMWTWESECESTIVSTKAFLATVNEQARPCAHAACRARPCAHTIQRSPPPTTVSEASATALLRPEGRKGYRELGVRYVAGPQLGTPRAARLRRCSAQEYDSATAQQDNIELQRRIALHWRFGAGTGLAMALARHCIGTLVSAADELAAPAASVRERRARRQHVRLGVPVRGQRHIGTGLTPATSVPGLGSPHATSDLPLPLRSEPDCIACVSRVGWHCFGTAGLVARRSDHQEVQEGHRHVQPEGTGVEGRREGVQEGRSSDSRTHDNGTA